MRTLALAALVLLIAGCAKLPPGGGGPQGKRIIITMVMDGELRDDYVYIIPLRVSNLPVPGPADDGPLPSIGPPWGNGFVSGNATHFIRWEPSRPRQFVLYRFNDPTLLNWTEIGLIENYDEIPLDDPNIEQAERKRLRFEVEVNMLADTPALAAGLQSVELNFLTMDRIGSGTQNWVGDALGNGAISQFEWGEFSLTVADIYTNANEGFIEPPTPGDSADPSLDFIDWQVEVRLQ